MKQRTTTILLALALLLGVALWLHSPYLRRAQAAGNAWASKTGMPTARAHSVSAEINGKLYVVGGDIGNFASLQTLEVYDPATDTWTSKAEIPTARLAAAAASISGKLYVVGGYNGSFLNTLEVYDPATNQWTTKAPMPTARHQLAAAAINGKLYVVGGTGANGTVKTLEVYDPDTDHWTRRAAMPTERDQLAAASLNGKLYVLGGVNFNGILNLLEVYDPATDTWAGKQGMPTSRADLAAAEINGKLYVVGGFKNGYQQTLEVYDPVTELWTSKQGMPTARSNLTAAAINGKLYAVGGNSGNGVVNTLEVYTPPEPNAWASKANMLTARLLSAAAALNGKFYVMGGQGSSSNLNTLEVYDPVTDTWTTKAPMPTARFLLAAAAINGKLYVVGGYDGFSILNTLEVYDPVTDTWVTKAPMPMVRYGLAAAAINGKLYVVGGTTPSGDTNKLEVYDPATDQWTSKTNMPTGRFSLAAASINGQLYVVGGLNSGYLNTLEVYDPITDQWTSKAGMPTARTHLAAAALNGKLYVVGGSYNAHAVDKLEVYDPATDQWIGEANMPTMRYGLAAAAINGKLYAVAGADTSNLNTLEVFQVASDLTLAKSHSSDFTLGTDGSYALSVNNAANANCTEGPITVTDTLPAGLSYASVTGTGWNCTANGQSVTCTNSSLTLDAGASSSFTLNVHTTALGTVTNYATVATTDEIVTNNNAANSGNGDPTMINCPTITTTLSGATAICPNGTATLSVDITGGTAPYTLKLSDGQQKTSSTLPITFTVSPMSTTAYSVQMLSDSYACGLTTSNSVTITVTQPDTALTSAPPATSGTDVSFRFMRNDNCGSLVTFECQLDSGGFSACTSPKSYSNLAGGSHKFEVRAKNATGQVDPSPAAYSWTVFTNTCGTVVNPTTLPAATRNAPFVQTLSASPTGSYTFSLLEGTLPPGLSLVNTLGVYSVRGTPTTAGTYQFTLKAVKANSTCAAVRTYTMVIP